MADETINDDERNPLVKWLNDGRPLPTEMQKRGLMHGVRLYETAEPNNINWEYWLTKRRISIEDGLWLSMPSPMEPYPYSASEKDIFDKEHDERKKIAEEWVEKGLLPKEFDKDADVRVYLVSPVEFFFLAKQEGWISPLNREHDPIFKFLDEAKQHTQDSTQNNITKAPPPVGSVPKGAGLAPNHTRLQKADYVTWAKADLWTIERAILLTLGVEARPTPDQYSGRCKSQEEQQVYEEFKKIWELAEGSIKAGKMPMHEKGYPTLLDTIDPCSYVRWVRSKGYEIPLELEELRLESHGDAVSRESDEITRQEKRQTEINRWLRDIWEEHEKPTGAQFFRILRRYKNVKGSPIVDWWETGKEAGISWKTSGGTSGEWRKKTIQTKVSEFRRADKEKSCQAK
ncbi:hypothetical protein [Methyloterricola oryzae]|uniref:hypothetical protein n=1 Tax=Methyloterricola oryzae TaxID=1495050 RepID=UPI0005EB1389|nr:hypothetical protein [Methyloterricola oryzae]